MSSSALPSLRKLPKAAPPPLPDKGTGSASLKRMTSFSSRLSSLPAPPPPEESPRVPPKPNCVRSSIPPKPNTSPGAGAPPKPAALPPKPTPRPGVSVKPAVPQLPGAKPQRHTFTRRRTTVGGPSGSGGENNGHSADENLDVVVVVGGAYPFDEPDSSSNIRFQEGTENTPRPVVSAGSLVKLVERLTYEKYPGMISLCLRVFVLCLRVCVCVFVFCVLCLFVLFVFVSACVSVSSLCLSLSVWCFLGMCVSGRACVSSTARVRSSLSLSLQDSYHGVLSPILLSRVHLLS
jgi:hypothetical protein